MRVAIVAVVLLSLMSLVSAQTYITGNLYAEADKTCTGDVVGVINVLDGGCDGDSRVKATCAANQVTWGVWSASATCAGTAPTGTAAGTVALNACVSFTDAENSVNNIKFTACAQAVPAAASATAVGTGIQTVWSGALTCAGTPTGATAAISTASCGAATGKVTYTIDNCNADGKPVTYTYSAAGCAVGTLIHVVTTNPTCNTQSSQYFNQSSKVSCSSSAISANSGSFSGASGTVLYGDDKCVGPIKSVSWAVVGNCQNGFKASCANGNITTTQYNDTKTCTGAVVGTPTQIKAGVCMQFGTGTYGVPTCSGAFASAVTVGITALVALFAVTVSMMNSM
jgi:hypothetical protein